MSNSSSWRKCTTVNMDVHSSASVHVEASARSGAHRGTKSVKCKFKEMDAHHRVSESAHRTPTAKESASAVCDSESAYAVTTKVNQSNNRRSRHASSSSDSVPTPGRERTPPLVEERQKSLPLGDVEITTHADGGRAHEKGRAHETAHAVKLVSQSETE